MAAKKTIKEIVIENSVTLKEMTTHSQLRDWAIDQGFDNRSAFPKFKLALNEIGLDYDNIKTGIVKAKAEDLEKKINYELTLYSDAKASHGMFGITDRNGDVVWYGRFFPEDNAGEQSRAELAAAKKAVWFASKVKESLGQDALMLNLIIDAEWLTYQDHSGQKGYELTKLANKYNLKLNVSWISGKNNPADEWTVASGYKKWQDNDLNSLVEPYLSDNKEVEEAEVLAEYPVLQEKAENNPLDTKLSKYDFLDWQLYDEFITQKENGFYVYTDNLFILTFNENKDHSKDYKQAVNQDLIINQLKKDGLFEKYGQFIIDAYSNVSYKKFNKEDARRLINNDTIVYLFSQNKLNSSSLESVFYRDNTESKQEQNIDEIEVIEEVIQDKSNDKPSAESKQRFSAVKEVNRNDIMLMPELFQGRPKAYSENSVDKIVSEGFDKTNDPIVTWWNPETEKHVVISGHSRFEASKRLYEKGDESLETMPIKEFLGDRQEAKLYALFESNRASDQEGLLADIKAVKLMIEEGYNKAEMLKNIKPNSYLEKILSYTYLNLDGRFIEYLTQPSSTSFPYLERNAGWVGDLKKFHKGKLTDAHESEIFEYIYQSGGVKGLRQTKDQFFNLINSKVAKLDFDSEKPLNLHNVVSTSAVTSSARQIIKEKQDDIDYFEKEISRKRDLIVRARQENKQDLIPQFEKFITDSSNRIIDLKEQIRKLESDIKGVENQVVFDLFSMSDNSPIMKKIEADIVKKESNDAFDEAKQDSVNEVTECHDELVYFAKNHNKEVIQVGSEISINGSTYNVVSLNSEKLKFKNITDDREITKTFSDLMSLFNKGLISFDGYNNNDKALFDLMIKSKQICIIREEDYKALTGTIDYSTEKISTLTNALKELLSQKEAIEIELGSVERNNEELTSEISIQKQKEADILKTEELESETIEQQRLLAIQDLESKESKKQAYLDKIEVYSEMVLNCKNKKKELEKEKETARYLSGKKKGSWGLSTEADKKRSAKVSAKIESYKTNCGNIEKYEDKIDIYLEMIKEL